MESAISSFTIVVERIENIDLRPDHPDARARGRQMDGAGSFLGQEILGSPCVCCFLLDVGAQYCVDVQMSVDHNRPCVAVVSDVRPPYASETITHTKKAIALYNYMTGI